MFNITEELKKLPASPGVYIMHDSEDHVLYVGKAVILKNRVRQYFQTSYKRSPKIEKMVSHIAWFEYIVTDSETEALILECNLIKEYRPPYNTMLTDDKGYPYIRISMSEKYPRVFLARKITRDGSKYFGPYTSHGAVRDAIELTRKIFKIRTCNRKLPEDIGKSRPCLNYHIGLCDGPCQGRVSEEDYKKRVALASDFLGGNYAPIKRQLKEKMQTASDEMDFETASVCRDTLRAITALEECQKISNVGGENRDIIALACEDAKEQLPDTESTQANIEEVTAQKNAQASAEAGVANASTISKMYLDAVAQIFFVREGKLIGRDHFGIRAASGDSKAQIISDVIKQFYAGTPFLPHEILVQNVPAEKEVLERWLSQKAGYKVELKTPQRGDKHKLMELAKENAGILLRQNKEQAKREEARTVGASRQLGQLLGIESLSRVEAYDISNTSGFQSVGSMIVFENGKPRKNDYRKFKIKTVEGPNDYASLYEVLVRRFSHGLSEMQEGGATSFSIFPDLIMMDGGKGQVKVAEDALSAVGVNIPICGMVKDDNHRTRGLYFNGVELPIDRHGEVFHLITRVQDEAHRFAIEYHRSLRGKNQVHSILDDIPGIGKVRRQALMREFPTIEAIKEASYEKLVAVPEINRDAARTVYAYFHDGELPKE